MGEVESQRIRKEYFVNLYNIKIREHISVHMCDFDGVLRGNYFRGEPIKRIGVKVRMGELKNGKPSGKDKVTGKMIKGGGEMMVEWI